MIQAKNHNNIRREKKHQIRVFFSQWNANKPTRHQCNISAIHHWA